MYAVTKRNSKVKHIIMLVMGLCMVLAVAIPQIGNIVLADTNEDEGVWVDIDFTSSGPDINFNGYARKNETTKTVEIGGTWVLQGALLVGEPWGLISAGLSTSVFEYLDVFDLYGLESENVSGTLTVTNGDTLGTWNMKMVLINVDGSIQVCAVPENLSDMETIGNMHSATLQGDWVFHYEETEGEDTWIDIALTDSGPIIDFNGYARRNPTTRTVEVSGTWIMSQGELLAGEPWSMIWAGLSKNVFEYLDVFGLYGLESEAASGTLTVTNGDALGTWNVKMVIIDVDSYIQVCVVPENLNDMETLGYMYSATLQGDWVFHYPDIEEKDWREIDLNIGPNLQFSVNSARINGVTQTFLMGGTWEIFEGSRTLNDPWIIIESGLSTSVFTYLEEFDLYGLESDCASGMLIVHRDGGYSTWNMRMVITEVAGVIQGYVYPEDMNDMAAIGNLSVADLRGQWIFQYGETEGEDTWVDIDFTSRELMMDFDGYARNNETTKTVEIGGTWILSEGALLVGEPWGIIWSGLSASVFEYLDVFDLYGLESESFSGTLTVTNGDALGTWNMKMVLINVDGYIQVCAVPEDLSDMETIGNMHSATLQGDWVFTYE